MTQQTSMFKASVAEPQSASHGAAVARVLRVASLAVMCVSLTLASALPATAAEPAQVGPTVTVNASRNPTATPSESAYIETAYKKLQRASRYPSGREASLSRPSGTATVWVDVARDGRVKGRGVDQSSGSPLLDDMAKSLVGRGRFPSFAAGDWDNGATHRFVVSYQFDGVAMTAGKAGKLRASTE